MRRIAVLALVLVATLAPVRAEQGPGVDDLIFAPLSGGAPTVEDQVDGATGLLALPALAEFGRGERLALQLELAEALRTEGSSPRRRMDAVVRRILGLAVPGPGADPAVTGRAAGAHGVLTQARAAVLDQVQAYEGARRRVADLVGLDPALPLTAAALDAASPGVDDLGSALVELSERADHLVRSYRRFAGLAAGAARDLAVAS